MSAAKNGPHDFARGWLCKADSDLANARQTIAGEGPYDTACFHAQQAIEKSLKAVIAYHGEPIPRTHELKGLAEQACRLAPGLELDRERCELRESLSVELRYDMGFWPDRAKAGEALAVAEDVRERAAAALPPEARP